VRRCDKSVQAGDLTEPWMSVEQVARHLGVAKDSVCRWIDHSDLLAHQIGRLWNGKEPAFRAVPLALLCSDRDACESRLRQAIRRVQEILERERLASVQVQAYFAGGIETKEQLEAALEGLREECLRLIGAVK
ncbi:MAG: helix-turn-helix domain-containing protein, partial [Steroidobacteraceae bacterium]